MTAIPNYFFINDKLHKKISIVKSDSSVLAFCYREERRVWLPLKETRKLFKKAFTISQAANLIRTTPGKLKEIFDKGEFPPPERSYDLSTFKRGTAFINQDDLLSLRQVCYDLLPKNKYGIPYRDELASEDELIHAITLHDDRDFIVVEGNYVRIYRA